MPTPRTIDAYFADLPADKRAALEKLRKAIRTAAPQAEEGMSYGMPAFIQGKPIAGYAASANHCAYYPMSGAVIAKLKDELQGYDTSKGAIRFPIGKPPSLALIRKLVKARLAEIEASVAKKRTGTRAAKGTADVHSDPAVAAWLRGLDHPLKRDIESVRRIVLSVSPDISEGIKWGVPSFRTAKDYFATFHVRAKDAVRLVFHRGAKARPNRTAMAIADPSGLMTWLAKDRCMITLGKGKDIAANRAAFEAIVRAWVAYV
jgi:uncharacterized protein YdhG (YjbR/CyaY superfamily)